MMVLREISSSPVALLTVSAVFIYASYDDGVAREA